VVTAEDNRWRRCDLKTISLVATLLMRQLAADADALETVDVPATGSSPKHSGVEMC